MTPELPGLAQQIAHFEHRLAADPGSRAFLPLADLYRRAGKLDDARRILEQGLDRHPGFVTARTALGLVLSELGEGAASREHLVAVVTRDPDNLLARGLLARLAAEAGRWAEARDHYERLLRLEPENREIREGLRAARRGAEESSDAREAAAVTIPDAGPMTPRSVAASAESMGFETPTLAELYLRQGHPAKARSIVERILAQEPGRQDARAVLARIEAGEDAGRPRDDGGGTAAGTEGSDAQEPRREEAAATPPTPKRGAAATEAAARADDLDRFRAWLDAATDRRDSAG